MPVVRRSSLFLALVPFLLAGCIGGPDTLTPGLDVRVSTLYDATVRDSHDERHRSVDLPPGTAAKRQSVAVRVHAIDGETYGTWPHTEPCAPGMHDMATGEVRPADCRAVEGSAVVVLPPPADALRLYVLDAGGEIHLRTPKPVLLTFLMDAPYSEALRDEFAGEPACYEEDGQALAKLGRLGADGGLADVGGPLLVQGDGTATLSFYGWCDRSVS